MDVFKIGSTDHDEAQGIAMDSQGKIYVSGNFEGTVDFDPSSNEFNLAAVGKYDAYLAKYDSDGNLIWVISIGGPEWIYGRRIVLDDQNNIYMVGYFKGEADFDPSAEDYVLEGVELDGYLAKYDSDGNFMWAFDIGNEYNCMAYDVGIDHDNNVWVSGTVNGAVDFDPSANEFILNGHGFMDAYIGKYTTDGEFIWAGEIGGELSLFYLPTFDFDDEGNIYYTSYFDATIDLDPGENVYEVESAGSTDILLIKLNNSGNFEWGFSMGGEFQDMTRDIVYDNGKVFITGMYEATIDFDPSEGEAIYTSNGDYDAYFAVYSTDGNYLFSKSIVSVDPTEGQTITIDSEKNIYMAGTFFRTVDFDPSEEVFELTAQGFWDMYTAKYTDEGDFVWAIYAGGNENDYAYQLLVDEENEETVVCGKFQGYAEFDHFGQGKILSSSGGFDGYLARYSLRSDYSVEDHITILEDLQLFPNPTSESVTLSFQIKKNTSLQISLLSLDGKEVLRSDMGELQQGNFSYTFEISSIGTGTYIMLLTNGSGTTLYEKLIKID